MPRLKGLHYIDFSWARCQPRTIWEEFPTVGRKWHLPCKLKLLSAAGDAKQAPRDTALWRVHLGILEHDISSLNCFWYKPQLWQTYSHSRKPVTDCLQPLINPCLFKGFLFGICLLLSCLLVQQSTTQVILFTLFLFLSAKMCVDSEK